MIFKRFNIALSCLIFIAHASYAYSVDFNIRGEWIIGFGYGNNGSFEGKYKGSEHTGWGGGQDSAEAKQKIVLHLDTVVSENLSGLLTIEMGDIFWGEAESGGMMGKDRNIIKVNNALIDFVFPQTDIKARLGIFNFSTPAMASGNSVFNGTAPGIMLSAPALKNLDISFFWIRLFNDNYTGYIKDNNPNFKAGLMDNIDAAGLLFPFVSDGFSITPWALYSSSGPNAFRSGDNADAFAFGDISTIGGANIHRAGMFPVGGARHKNFEDANTKNRINNYSNGWWAGITGSLAPFKDFLIYYDLEYGYVSWPNSSRLNRRGWFASILFEYMFDWGKPGIYCWHSSGDDSNPANGSERLPFLDGDDSITYSHFAFNGSPYLERNSLIGANLGGTWGLGFRILDASFWENIIHTFRINLICGTNSPGMAKKMSLAGLWANGRELNPNNLGEGASLGMPNLYLTSWDKVLEVSSSTTFKIFNDLLVCLEGAYAGLWLNASAKAWGARHLLKQTIPQTRDAMDFNISFVFSF